MHGRLERSKAQAIFFLLGAVLVGGALGFTANRAIEHRAGHSGQQSSRSQLADRLGLDDSQRRMLDSVLNERNEKMKALLAPVRPQLDSLRFASRALIRSRLTAEQRAEWDQFLVEMSRDTVGSSRR